MKAPLKVEAFALKEGAHRTCVADGPDNACSMCRDYMMIAFDFFYGDISADRLRTRIAADLAAEGRLVRSTP